MTEHSRSETVKRHTLLQTLHRCGTSSRLSLARELHISNSRVCNLVDEMIRQGLLAEEGDGGERRGRRGVGIGLNPEYGHLIGFDLEAKRLRMVITDFAGKTLWQGRRAMRSHPDRAALIAEIFDFIDSSVVEAKMSARNLLGIGIAAGGLIDTRRGVILHYDLIPQAVDLPLRDLIAEKLKVPCVMENNIRALTLAEWADGSAKGLGSFICVAVRSGVGAGIVINGKLLAGAHGFAGELGYMVIPGTGAITSWKSLQETVSESALGVDADTKDFVLPESLARRSGELLGAQLASLAAALDPEAIVLAGELLKPEGAIWPHVLSTFRRVGLSDVAERVSLLPARLGPYAAAIGAAHSCLYELFPVGIPTPA